MSDRTRKYEPASRSEKRLQIVLFTAGGLLFWVTLFYGLYRLTF